MSFAVYTSCAANYLPKARALAESLRRHQPDATLTLCLCDRVPPGVDLAEEPFDRVWTPEDLGYDRAWIFQHNVMELCTGVKGRALERLMEDEADLYLYLDPDVLVLHPLEPIHRMMEGASIGLVPHILRREECARGVELTEMSITEHGIYNLGHLLVRGDPNGHAFARWWRERLDEYCFDDRERGLFTDQRWADLVPAIFEGVRILRQPVLNVASWNLYGRTISQEQPSDDSTFRVDGEPLITYHFSGTGPSGTHRRIRETFDPGNGATAAIEALYEATIARHGQGWLEPLSPAHDSFDDGTPVPAEARKLYRRHEALRTTFPDPYTVPENGGFRGWLMRNRPRMGAGIAIAEQRLDRAWEELFDAEYYLATHAEAAADIEEGRYESAEDHYVSIGSRLMLDPNPLFVSRYYIDRAQDLDGWRLSRPGRQGTLIWHYLTTGLAHGIEPVEFFDSRWYLDRHPDVDRAVRSGGTLSPMGHYLRYGGREGRDPGPGFVAGQYLKRTPEARDLAEREGAFAAFVRLGGVKGRIAA